MRKIRVVAIPLLLLMATLTTCAFPSLAGSTGTGILPTAETNAAGEVTVGVNVLQTANSPLLGNITFPDTGNTIMLQGVVGLGDIAEFGMGVTTLSAYQQSANSVSLSAKLLAPQQVSGCNVAVGARYANTQLQSVDTTLHTSTVYLVATRHGLHRGDGRRGDPDINGTLGLSWTSRENTLTNTRSACRLYGGAELIFPSRLVVAADVQSQSDALDRNPLFSVVTRYPVTDNLVVDIGVTNADITMASASADTNLFAGMHLTITNGR